MTRERFEALVAQAITTIPDQFREHMQNLAVVVEDEPSQALLMEMEVEPPDTLLGLYQGTPLTERSWDYGNRLPDQIVLFQHPIEDGSTDEDDTIVAIGETLIHEIGHYFGMSEDDLQEIEDTYWHARRRGSEREQ